MKIAIIGAGFTGLSAAYELSKKGHDISVFEKGNLPGGLAVGYKEKGWDWSLEKHYHHWFTNDKAVLNLAKDIGYEVITRRPKTSVYVRGKSYQLDSPVYVLKFPLLSILERLRMGFIIAFLKYNPYWKPLEKYNATLILPKWMGKTSYKLIWESLLQNKFGSFASNISLAWFWARLRKRTPSLAYPKGGFLNFANALVKEIKKHGGRFYFDTEVLELSAKPKPRIKIKSQKLEVRTEEFDVVIVTLPSFLFTNITSGLPRAYVEKLQQLKHLGATSLILRLSKPFLADNTYWLNVCDKTSPIMAIVEHTNYMDKRFYNNEHLLYLGNYKLASDKYFSMDKKEMLKLFDPYLKKINPGYAKNIISYEFFKDPFAQPVIPVNYSRLIPPLETPLKNIFLANIEQVYPWDRGTNYAVELGQKIAKIITNV